MRSFARAIRGRRPEDRVELRHAASTMSASQRRSFERAGNSWQGSAAPKPEASRSLGLQRVCRRGRTEARPVAALRRLAHVDYVRPRQPSRRPTVTRPTSRTHPAAVKSPTTSAPATASFWADASIAACISGWSSRGRSCARRRYAAACQRRSNVSGVEATELSPWGRSRAR